MIKKQFESAKYANITSITCKITPDCFKFIQSIKPVIVIDFLVCYDIGIDVGVDWYCLNKVENWVVGDQKVVFVIKRSRRVKTVDSD